MATRTIHKLTDVDIVTKTAVCSICGVTDIHVPNGKTYPTCIAQWNSTLERVRNRKRKFPSQPRHMLTNVDSENKIAVCSVCGPTELWIGGQGRVRCVAAREHSNAKKRKSVIRATSARGVPIHRLTEIDYEAKTAMCSVCGLTEIRVPAGKKERPKCIIGYNEMLEENKKWRHAKKAAQGIVPVVRHIITNVDEENLTGDCNQCGRVEVKRKMNKGVIGWKCITKHNEHQESSVSATAGHGLTRGESYRFVMSMGKCQNPRCGKILEGPGVGPDGGQVDHDHATGEIRGVLCGACNWALGNAVDNIEVLQGLIEYLKNPPGYVKSEDKE